MRRSPTSRSCAPRRPRSSGCRPIVEVHISNIHARESFRHHSFTARAAFATLCGFGIDGYRLAINGLAARIGVKAKA
jgi:3-dehydroquinate dehydratase-2